jgi:hypothetical protein
MDTPKYYEFMNPILQALREGGGTLTNEEMVDAVARIMHLPNQVMERRQGMPTWERLSTVLPGQNPISSTRAT